MPYAHPFVALVDEKGHLWCTDCTDDRPGIRVDAGNSSLDGDQCEGCGKSDLYQPLVNVRV